MKSFKSGFSLCELLIISGVTGFIAVSLLSSLIKAKPDANITMYKKAYTVFSKTVNYLINNETYYPEGLTGTTIGGLTKPQGFFNTNLTGLPAGNDKFCYLFSQKINTLGIVTCTSPGKGSFSTADGMVWSMTLPFTFPMSVNGYQTVMVDVNGAKPPNCQEGICTSGVVPDQYALMVRYDGKIKASPLGETILSNPTSTPKDIMAQTPEVDTPEVEPTPPDTCVATGNIKIGNICTAPTNITYYPMSQPPFSSNNNYWAGADAACRSYGMRLPTKDELMTIYKQRKSIPGMDPGWYWSADVEPGIDPTSPPETWTGVDTQEFNNGNHTPHGKDDHGGKARCVLQWGPTGYY